MSQQTHTHIISDCRTGNIRVRAVNATSVAHNAAAKVAETGKACIRAAHGGSVCNNYGYPAETEVALVVAVPLFGAIHVAVYATQIPANKVTLGGAAASCLASARPLFDGRYGAAAKSDARRDVVRIAKSDIACSLDAVAAAKRQQRREAKAKGQAAERARLTLAQRLQKYKAMRLSERVAAFNAAHREMGYCIEVGDRNWLHLRSGRYGYVKMNLRSVAECVEAMQADLPRRQAEAARREEEYAASVMATVPQGRIRFDAEGGFRVEN